MLYICIYMCFGVCNIYGIKFCCLCAFSHIIHACVICICIVHVWPVHILYEHTWMWYHKAMQYSYNYMGIKKNRQDEIRKNESNRKFPENDKGIMIYIRVQKISLTLPQPLLFYAESSNTENINEIFHFSWASYLRIVHSLVSLIFPSFSHIKSSLNPTISLFFF